mmetsp:Transcript_1374/g.3052  ORF Transcript_1374/g.3052 Transcript_1374/m.3052 type:complete len:224 (-) Transcript_1374:793-1464(-)
MVLQNTMTFFPVRKSPDTICSTTAILSTDPGQSMNRCFRLGAERCRLGVSIVCKPGSSWATILATFSAMVADTMMHCFPAGLFCIGRRSRRTSSAKPFSNRVSASSRMMWVTPERNMLPSSTCFIRRPGVPTTTSSGRLSCSRCVANFSPPIMSSDENRAWCDTCFATPRTCSASSRVGPTMSTRGRLGFARAPVSASSRRSCWMTGRRYVSVLPLPVCDATR